MEKVSIEELSNELLEIAKQIAASDKTCAITYLTTLRVPREQAEMFVDEIHKEETDAEPLL